MSCSEPCGLNDLNLCRRYPLNSSVLVDGERARARHRFFFLAATATPIISSLTSTHIQLNEARVLYHTVCVLGLCYFSSGVVTAPVEITSQARDERALCSGRKGQILMHPGRRILGRFTPIIRLLLTTLKFSYLCQFEIIFL
jgi:hypothetical protein